MSLDDCKIYLINYTAYGRNRRYFTTIESFAIAVDVIDLVTQINNDCLGVEIQCLIDDTTFYDVTEEIVINNCALVGNKLHGISDKAWAILHKIAATEQQNELEEESEEDS